MKAQASAPAIRSSSQSFAAQLDTFEAFEFADRLLDTITPVCTKN